MVEKSVSNPVGGNCPTCRHVMFGPIDPNNVGADRPMCCMWGPPLPVPTQVQVGIDPKTGQPIMAHAMATARAMLNKVDWCWQYQRASTVASAVTGILND